MKGAYITYRKDDLIRTVTLKKKLWAKVQEGKPSRAQGNKIVIDGMKYQDTWYFNVHNHGDVIVIFSCTGGKYYYGKLEELTVREYAYSYKRKAKPLVTLASIDEFKNLFLRN